ncbi:hypothetical protein K438DRAFT_1851071, partial [Mycena galopus ATCC 62051]
TTRTTLTPLPKAQLTALYIARLSDPISYTYILPFMSDFLHNTTSFGLYTSILLLQRPLFYL